MHRSNPSFCKRLKGKNDFYTQHRTICKACLNEYNRRYYKLNRAKYIIDRIERKLLANSASDIGKTTRNPEHTLRITTQKIVIDLGLVKINYGDSVMYPNLIPCILAKVEDNNQSTIAPLPRDVYLNQAQIPEEPQASVSF